MKNIYLIDNDAKDQLDTIIVNNEDFIKLLSKHVAKLSKGDEKSVKEILDKSYRRLDVNYIPNFISYLIDEITIGNIKWLSIGIVKASSKENQSGQHFVRM